MNLTANVKICGEHLVKGALHGYNVISVKNGTTLTVLV